MISIQWYLVKKDIEQTWMIITKKQSNKEVSCVDYSSTQLRRLQIEPGAWNPILSLGSSETPLGVMAIACGAILSLVKSNNLSSPTLKKDIIWEAEADDFKVSDHVPDKIIWEVDGKGGFLTQEDTGSIYKTLGKDGTYIWNLAYEDEWPNADG